MPFRFHPVELSSAAGEEVARNVGEGSVPFGDGNTRTGAAASEVMLLVNAHVLSATDDEMEQVTMSVARGEMEIEPLTIWLRQRIAQRD